MAKVTKKVTKKRVKKNVERGQAHIQSSFNNTMSFLILKTVLNYFFLFATVLLGPLRVLAFVFVFWPRTGSPFL